MTRPKKILLGTGIGLLVLVALLLVVLFTLDWNRFKPQINQRVSEATGRPFAINGDLSVEWHRSQSEGGGWRSLVPWPQIRAQDIVLGNPEWAGNDGQMVQVRQVMVSLNPVPLLTKTVSIPHLQVEGGNLLLKRDAEGRNNWTFQKDDKKEEPSNWTMALDKLVLHDTTVRVDDAINRIDVRANIDSLDEAGPKGYGIGWKISGKYRDAEVAGTGKAGAVLSLQDTETPYPVQADLIVGKTFVGVEGTLTNPGQLSGVDMALKVSGASMSLLYPLTGVGMPATPAFSTEGRVIGTLRPGGGDWTYEKFKGRVGESDLSGTLTYLSREPRPLLKGQLESKLLRLTDLAPSVGADSNAAKKERTEPTMDKPKTQPADKALPVEPFHTERWTTIDADIKFTGRRIIRDAGLPIDDLKTEMKMTNGVLSATPLNFGVAGGNIVSDIRLDGRGDTVKAKMNIALKRLKLKQLVPDFEPMKSSFGELNGNAALTANGKSPAALLANADGELQVLINEGTISKFLLEAIGLNVGNVIVTRLFGDKQVDLNCLASDFVIKNGVMEARTFVVDTSEALLTIDGQVNLKDEKLGLTIRPDTKGFRLFSLRSPIYVGGTFKKPDVDVNKALVAAKAGSAIALGAIAPITALIPLINAGEDKPNQCGALLSRIGAKADKNANSKAGAQKEKSK